MEDFLEPVVMWLIHLYQAKYEVRVRRAEDWVQILPPCTFALDTPSLGSVSHLYNGEVGPDGLSQHPF